MRRPAFTLLEVLVYLALAAIFLGGLESCVYDLAYSAGVDQSKILLETEGQFLLGKFDWAFLGARNFSLGQGDQTLTIKSYNSVWPMVFDLQDGHIRLVEGGSPAIDLNCDAVVISNLLFRDMPAAGGQPASVNISFTAGVLNGRDRIVTQPFSFTEYLEQ